MNQLRKYGIILIIIYTLIITELRAFRHPNDYAEAHWLLDYQFGFVKRGLIGEIVSLVTKAFSIPITENLIFILSCAALFIFSVVMLVLSGRIIKKIDWSTGAVLVSLVFLSSPFIVMSAHLIGYYDNLVIILGIFSVVLIMKNRPWSGACLQIIALLVHESSILLVFAPFCLAWILSNSRHRKSGTPALRFIPLLLPVFAFIIMTITQELFLGKDFDKLLSAYLSQFSFIQQNQSTLMPMWISTSFFDWFSWLSREFPRRIFAIDMLGMALPSALSILFFTMTAHKIRDISAESVLLIGVCITPLLMHLVAWDISRIWTYTILDAFLALWIYSEIYPSKNASSVIRLFCLTALVVNAMIRVPLMDGQVDQFSSITRVFLYTPVILSSVILILLSKDITIKDRLTVQGYNIVKIIIPNKHWNSISETATLESTEESDY